MIERSKWRRRQIEQTYSKILRCEDPRKQRNELKQFYSGLPLYIQHTHKLCIERADRENYTSVCDDSAKIEHKTDFFVVVFRLFAFCSCSFSLVVPSISPLSIKVHSQKCAKTKRLPMRRISGQIGCIKMSLRFLRIDLIFAILQFQQRSWIVFGGLGAKVDIFHLHRVCKCLQIQAISPQQQSLTQHAPMEFNFWRISTPKTAIGRNNPKI